MCGVLIFDICKLGIYFVLSALACLVLFDHCGMAQSYSLHLVGAFLISPLGLACDSLLLRQLGCLCNRLIQGGGAF